MLFIIEILIRFLLWIDPVLHRILVWKTPEKAIRCRRKIFDILLTLFSKATVLIQKKRNRFKFFLNYWGRRLSEHYTKIRDVDYDISK